MKKATEHAFPLVQARNNKKIYAPSMSVIVIQLGSNYRLFQEKSVLYSEFSKLH